MRAFGMEKNRLTNMPDIPVHRDRNGAGETSNPRNKSPDDFSNQPELLFGFIRLEI